jgi:hypothetical protein
LTGVAGALAYADEIGSTTAVFVVHEFVTDETRDDYHARNARDLNAFIARISGGSMTSIVAGQLIGPFLLQPSALFPHPPDLFIGKATRRLRAPDA